MINSNKCGNSKETTPFGFNNNDVPLTKLFQSKLITSDLLKDEMGFTGIVVTDALEMGGITRLTSAGEACVRAIEAGAYIVFLPLDVTTAINSIYDAVKSGRISEERINESVNKIWNRKITGIFCKGFHLQSRFLIRNTFISI